MAHGRRGAAPAAPATPIPAPPAAPAAPAAPVTPAPASPLPASGLTIQDAIRTYGPWLVVAPILLLVFTVSIKEWVEGHSFASPSLGAVAAFANTSWIPILVAGGGAAALLATTPAIRLFGAKTVDKLQAVVVLLALVLLLLSGLYHMRPDWFAEGSPAAVTVAKPVVMAEVPGARAFPCPAATPYRTNQCRMRGAVRVANDQNYPPGVFNLCYTFSGGRVLETSEGNVSLFSTDGSALIDYRLVPVSYYEPGGYDGGRCPRHL